MRDSSNDIVNWKSLKKKDNITKRRECKSDYMCVGDEEELMELKGYHRNPRVTITQATKNNTKQMTSGHGFSRERAEVFEGHGHFGTLRQQKSF